MDKTPSISDCKNVAPEEVPEVLDHFIVRPMSSHDTPDQVRAQLDNVIEGHPCNSLGFLKQLFMVQLMVLLPARSLDKPLV